VVAHTHWDREWYSAFETYQARLVDVVDDLLGALEADSSFSHFLLDGQVALVDDYLAVRPGARERLETLIRAGRLAIGPWYVLPDEFCVSGETLVRNLQLGLRRSDDLGGSSGVGYLPDMFGHVCQMPQILRLAGLAHAVVWRGVPSSVRRTGFLWTAPDGSEVRAEYLPVGYANGAALPSEPRDLLRRVKALEEEIEGFLPRGWPMLLMNGSDHTYLQPYLPELLERANDLQDGFLFEQSTLGKYLESAPVDGLPVWRGELRSGARSNLLMGVLSTRADIKLAAAAAERELEKQAEPLCATWLQEDLWPGDLLEQAWLAMIRNSAHDSICGCSADVVARAVVHRFDSASALAAVATQRAVEMAMLAVGREGPVVLNPSPFPREGVVEVVLAGDVPPPPGGQVLERREEQTETRSGRGAQLGRILGELAGDGCLGEAGRPTRASISEDGDGLRISLLHDAARSAEPSTASVMAEAWARAGAARDRPLSVVVHQEAFSRVAVPVEVVPGYGWRCWEPVTEVPEPVVAGAPSQLSNGMVELTVDQETGMFSLGPARGMDLLVDERDDGDTYNYSGHPGGSDAAANPPPVVQIRLLEAGPARGRILVSRSYAAPPHGRDADDPGGVTGPAGPLEVKTVIELLAGDPLVRVSATVDNRRLDHRLRTLFRLPEVSGETVAECAFATVTRGPAEGGPHEPALSTYPSRRFVSAGGLTVFHDGLLEHELVGGGTHLAVTLLRCTGILSRPAIPARPNRAGPAVAVPGAQMQGVHTLRYALVVGDVNPWRTADTAWMPLIAAHAPGGGPLGLVGSRLQVSGATVSALHRRAGRLEIRMFNPSDLEAEVHIDGHSGTLVDLLDRPIARFDGSFLLGPWTIATAHLDAPHLD
jgi:alpha-mannosidase